MASVDVLHWEEGGRRETDSETENETEVEEEEEGKGKNDGQHRRSPSRDRATGDRERGCLVSVSCQLA